ncbi:MAG: hypothetical protein K6A65_00635 [Succinivibrionaceae bacterium]|nr:hypothetical protein [Succinivibrionaceae bacterium]
MKKLLASLALLLGLAACTSEAPRTATGPQDQGAAYAQALAATAAPSAEQACHHLLAITPGAPGQEWITENGRDRVLVASFMKARHTRFWEGGKPFTLAVDSWVTVPAEWAQRRDEFAGLGGEALRMRMVQMLGLPPDSENSMVVEFYADPHDLFRPSRDGEIDDQVAGLTYPPGTTDSHRNWFEYQLRLYRDSDPKFPWTQLGYSYDWGSAGPSHVGMSEFVVPRGSTVRTKRILGAEEFIREWAAPR